MKGINETVLYVQIRKTKKSYFNSVVISALMNK